MRFPSTMEVVPMTRGTRWSSFVAFLLATPACQTASSSSLRYIILCPIEYICGRSFGHLWRHQQQIGEDVPIGDYTDWRVLLRCSILEFETPESLHNLLYNSNVGRKIARFVNNKHINSSRHCGSQVVWLYRLPGIFR